MTSRERVTASCTFRAPDRVPVDLNLTLFAYQSLLEYLGSRLRAIPQPNAAMEVVPDPSVLRQIGVDLISVKPGREEKLKKGVSVDDLPQTTTDGWGITHKLVRQSAGAYYEIVSNPLGGATLADLEDYPWPACDHGGKDAALHDSSQALYCQTDLALVGRFGGPILEIAAGLVGIEEWYLRLATDRPFISALLERISTICTAQDIKGINSCGRYLQIMKVSGEDFGMQTGLLFSRQMFTEIILPPLKRRWRAVRTQLDRVNPEAKIMLHSCGAIRPFIADLLEAGIDIIDPVQPMAHGMDPRELKSEFGNRVVFHGGLDVQHLLPTGTPAEVRRGTIECLEGFEASKGGFILAPSHTVQADVPPQNILAMVEAARSY